MNYKTVTIFFKECILKAFFEHNIDPILTELGPFDIPVLGQFGPLKISYYGLLFGLAAIIGLYILKYLFKKKDYPESWVEDYVIYLLVGIVIGARLIHVLFYNTDYYLSNPMEILYIWKGGIASHGATLGAVAATMAFAWRKKEISFYQLADLAVIPISLGTMNIRLGNFINSEIVGRISDISWSVSYQFKHYQIPEQVLQFYRENLSDNTFLKNMIIKAKGLDEKSFDQLLLHENSFRLRQVLSELPRHPSQIYEMLYGLICFIILFALFSTKREKLADGVLFYTFFICYFVFRFITEFFKEFQSVDPAVSYLTMGQYLSIPFILVGIGMVWYLQKNKKTTI